MAEGPFTWFNAAIDKIADGSLLLGSNPFYASLVGSAQAIDPTFVGASGDCRYADLTAELATANGYTVGGVALAGIVFSRAVNVVSFTASPIDWTLTNTINYKYLIIRSDNVNDDLLCFMDANTLNSGAVATPTAGLLRVTPHASGILGWQRI